MPLVMINNTEGLLKQLKQVEQTLTKGETFPCEALSAIRRAIAEAEAPRFEMVCQDFSGDLEGWNRMMVVRLPEGYCNCNRPPPEGGTEIDSALNLEDADTEVLEFAESQGFRIVAEGHGDPGSPFANAPWIQWFTSYAIVEQSGGLDI